MYQKLKRTWSHNDLNYIPKFKETFPELSRVSNEILADRFNLLELDFYTENPAKVKMLIRLTLPFAVGLILLMFLMMPVVFIVTGRWGYQMRKKPIILNWFRQLNLFV